MKPKHKDDKVNTLTSQIENTNGNALTLPDLATQIKTHHDACREAVGTALHHAMAAGDLLIEAKTQCVHGEWSTWLADNFDGSPRTAQVFMRLAAHRDEIESKSADSAVLSIDRAVKLLAAPQEEHNDVGEPTPASMRWTRPVPLPDLPEPYELTPVGLKIRRESTRREWIECGFRLSEWLKVIDEYKAYFVRCFQAEAREATALGLSHKVLWEARQRDRMVRDDWEQYPGGFNAVRKTANEWAKRIEANG